MERESFGLPKLELPPEPKLTPEELERRHQLVERILKRRDEIGPLDLTWEELMGEEDEDDDG